MKFFQILIINYMIDNNAIYIYKHFIFLFIVMNFTFENKKNTILSMFISEIVECRII